MSSSFADATTRPIEWLIEDLIPRNTVTLISAPAGFGKSIIGLHMALCILTDSPWLGYNCKQGGVAYWDQDNPDRVLSDNRLIAISKGLGLDAIPRSPASLLFRTNRSITASEIELRGLINRLVELEISAIFVDTLAAVNTRPENAAEEMAQVIVNTFFPMVESGITPILFHHMGKEMIVPDGKNIKIHRRGGVNAARGSSALPAACGAVFNLEMNPDTKNVILHCVKPRYGKPPKLEFAYDEQGEIGNSDWKITLKAVKRRETPDSVTQLLMRPESEFLRSMSSRQLMRALQDKGMSISQSTANRALQKVSLSL